MSPRIPIFNMFGRSPIGPLEKHMGTIHDCAQTLLPFFEKVMAREWDEAEGYYKKIASLEQEADKLKKEIRLTLPTELFLPVSRSDLLIMLVLQDQIADKVKDIAGLVIGRQMEFPEPFPEAYIKLLKRCLDAESQARKAINELDELLEAGFRGKEASLVEDMIHELDEIENDTDMMQVMLRRNLFAIERDLPPINVIFLYKIIEWTGDLADRAQNVGGQLELLIAH